MPLTDKQERFVAEYLVDLCAAKAAVRAGYSEHTARSIGHELLGKPDIADAIAAAKEARAERVEITQDWVLGRLKDVAERSLQAEPVTDREGMPTGEYTFNAAGANRSLELLGKHLGLFRERVEHSGPDGGPVAASLTVSFVKPGDGEG